MKKGEIWMVDLPEGKGHEQKGERPALVIATSNGLTVVVPLTKTMECGRFAFTLLIEKTQENGLYHDSIALIFQITALDNTRFKHQMGRIRKEKLDAVDGLLANLFKIRM